MLNTIEAVMNEHGEIRLLEPVRSAGRRRVLVTVLDEPPPSDLAPPEASGLLAFLDELERLPFSTRTTEEMDADIQAERDAWE